MPTWSNQLPPLCKHTGYDIRRTPATSALQAIVTNEDILVCNTHYFHGRTTPCEKPECAACNEGMPSRTHVYVSAFDPRTQQHFIFECTSNAAKAFADYRDANGTLRGCHFYATRPKGTKNSKVVIQTNTANLGKINIPSPPDLVKALCVIWRIPTDGATAKKEKHRPPIVKTNNNRLRDMRFQPDNMPDPPTIGDIIAGNNNGKKTKTRI